MCIFIEDKLLLNIPQVNVALYPACFIFIEDKRHLGIAIQTSLMSLLSICIIFVEDKLRLNIDQVNLSLFSACIIFA